jgi:ferredoxin
VNSNNQTCTHQGVAPINLQECLHKNECEGVCPICAYEIGFLEGSSNKWSDFDDYISSENLISKCINGTNFIKNKFDIIKGNKSGFNQELCIYCSFKLGFEASYQKIELENIDLIRVDVPKIISAKTLH